MEPNEPMRPDGAPATKSKNSLVIILVAIAGGGFAILLVP